MNKTVTFKDKTSFTLSKPALKEYFTLYDLEFENRHLPLLEEVLKHITYPSKEDASKFFKKYPGSLRIISSAISEMCGGKINVDVKEENEDSLIYLIEGKNYSFKRLSLSQWDLIWEEISQNKFLKSQRAYSFCMSCVLDNSSEELGTGKKNLELLFEQYPALVNMIPDKIVKACTMWVEEEQGKF